MTKNTCDICGKEYRQWRAIAITRGRKTATLVLEAEAPESWFPLDLCRSCVIKAIGATELIEELEKQATLPREDG